MRSLRHPGPLPLLPSRWVVAPLLGAIVAAGALAAACTPHEGSRPHKQEVPAQETVRPPASEATPAKAAPPPAPSPSLSSRDDDSWPSLPYSKFVPDDPDEGHRRAAFELFHLAERQARTFAPGRWTPVVRVEFSPATSKVPGDWTGAGVIQVEHDFNAPMLFHEVFHPAYNNSEFHQGKGDRDGGWTEAFCNAFRYFAERELMPAPTKWVEKFDRIAKMTEQEGLGNGDHRMRFYVYPAALVIKRAGGPKGSIATLRQLWFELVALRIKRGAPVLSDFFGFSPGG